MAPFHWLTQLHTGNPLALEAFELQHGSFKQQQTGEKRKGKEEEKEKEKEKESNTTAAKHNSREQQSNSSGEKERKRLGPEREVGAHAFEHRRRVSPDTAADSLSLSLSCPGRADFGRRFDGVQWQSSFGVQSSVFTVLCGLLSGRRMVGQRGPITHGHRASICSLGRITLPPSLPPLIIITAHCWRTIQ